MRRLIPALLLLAVPSLALGEDIDAAMTRAIFALATMGYADPGKAVMRDVHKLLTRNGKGYCGEVTIEGSDSFTGFHAIIARAIAGKVGTTFPSEIAVRTKS